MIRTNLTCGANWFKVLEPHRSPRFEGTPRSPGGSARLAGGQMAKAPPPPRLSVSSGERTGLEAWPASQFELPYVFNLVLCELRILE